MNSLTRYRRSLRGNKWIVLLALALMVALPAACQTTPAADTDSGDAVEITGTEGAAGADDTAGGVPTLDADAMRTQALQSLTAIVEQATKAVTTPEPGAEDGGAASQSPELGEPSDGAESSALEKVREQQATRDAAENIADVDHLVLSMPVMATFTPDPEGSDVSGHLVYLRNGGFWRIDAASEVREALDLDDDAMPRVFAPPNDPGRAWTSPDGTHMAFFAGPDAAMWISGTDGGYNHAVSEPLLPTDQYELAVVGGEAQSVRLRPGEDYTMVFLTESERPFSKLIDDNSYHIKGQARLRIVHAAAGESGRALVPFINGQPWGSNTAIAYGQATENRAITSGAVDLDLHDISGKPLVQLPEFEADEKELKTVFVIGDDELRAMQYSYEPSEAPSGNSRVRVFNSGDEPLDVMIEDEVVLRGVEPGTLSPYVNVAAVFGTDERQDAELAIYSLRTGEDQVAWSPDSKKLAFVGSPDGQMDIYVTSIDGPATRVSSDDWREVNPRWSPDGKSLVWEALDERLGEHHIGVLLAGEKEPHFVDMSSLRSQLGWDAGTVVVFPEPIDWATNRLVYLYPKADRGPGGIWVYDIGSDTLRQLYDGSILGPDYSPEAESWAFGTNEGQLYTLSTSGDLQRLPADDGYYPLWSPDGSKISWVEGGPLSETGWRIHVVNADGSGDVALTDWLPVLQSEPPVPGPNAKRWWLSDGEELAFTRAGRDYGAADRAGGYGVIEAGDDIENVWIVPTDGSESPRQATDLVKVFYLKEPIESEDGSTFGLVGFSYRDRVVQLWTVPRDGGKPVKIDGPVRWFAWSD